MDDREWAARWVGGQSLRDYEDDCASDADLAEAVRAHYYTEPEGVSFDDACPEILAAEWFNEGPIAFIAAVREVVES